MTRPWEVEDIVEAAEAARKKRGSSRRRQLKLSD